MNYHIHGRSDSLGSFAKGNESLFSNASSLWFLLYQIFQNPEASQVDLFRGGIVNGSGFALACFNFNCYFSCRGLCHSPHSLWMITAALSEAVPSPLSLFPLFLTRQREGFWLLASPKASKCFALVSGSPGIFFSIFTREQRVLYKGRGRASLTPEICFSIFIRDFFSPS